MLRGACIPSIAAPNVAAQSGKTLAPVSAHALKSGEAVLQSSQSMIEPLKL
jgi:hypothetical protein